MESKVEVVPATPGHINQMAPRVRQCDQDELWAQTHMRAKDALNAAINIKYSESFACILNGVVVAVFGIVKSEANAVTPAENAGILWLIGTDDIYENKDLFHKHTAEWLSIFRSRYDHISNWVDSRNMAAVKWIESVGFTVYPPMPYGPDGIPFHFFEWRAD